ncbi:YfhO family protein [Thermoactinomyces mirandus]|uniref:YfhO family protein n=1 Tax=Thermoactinomyces mirandus TaxID=2756294 RepID=A0A7W2ATM8_9BACL|nr:YfhO family protein [Thermoactinomyces mirandus]MBA4603920.1 YfhO family protein [Thermoactinomyces mirandus]
MKLMKKYWDLPAVAASILLVAVFIFARLFTSDFYFISKLGDTKEQYIHFFNLFYDLVHSGGFPFWSWSYGMGGSFWNDFGYYMLGDFFVWPLLLFPKNWFPTLFLPMNILKLIVMGLGIYLLLKEFGVRKRFAFLGAMVYPFAGFNIEHFYTHYFFLNAAAIFPFILLGYERLLKEKSSAVFVISIFLGSISNFYFMFMMSLGLLLYAFFRFFAQEVQPVSLKNFINFHSQVLLRYFIGFGIAMVFFLPSVFSFLSSNSYARSGPPIEGIMGLEEVPSFIMLKGGLHYIGLLLFPLLLINGKKMRVYGWLGLTLWIIMQIPRLTSVFGGFSNPEELRGFFIFNSIWTMLAILALDRIDIRKPKNIVVLIVSLLFICNANYPDLGKKMTALIPLTCLCFFLYGHVQKKWLKSVFFAGLAISLIGYSFLGGKQFVNEVLNVSYKTTPRAEKLARGVWQRLPLLGKEEYQQLYNNSKVNKTIAELKKQDPSFHRIWLDAAISMKNSAMSYGYHGFSVYHSLVPWKQQEFEMDLLAISGFRGLSLIRGFNNNLYLSTLMANKYLVAESKNGENAELFGYQPIFHKNGYSVYRNDNFVPLGFVYDRSIAYSQFLKIPVPYRDRLLFEYAVVPDSETGSSSKPSFASLGLKQIGKLKEVTYSKGIKVLQTDQGIILESKEPFEIRIPLAQHQAGELSVFVDFLPYTPNGGITMTASNGEAEVKFEKNMCNNKYRNVQYSYKTTVNQVLYRFGREEQDTKMITLTIYPGKFLIKNMGVYLDSLASYEKIVDDHQTKGLKTTEITNNRVKGTVSAKNGGTLFLSIPYSSGWKAFVDGKEVETFPVHHAFTGLKVGSGVHEIELRFTPPGFVAGLVVSGISLVIWAFLACRRRKRARVCSAETFYK